MSLLPSPDFLKQEKTDSIIEVFSNGEINYTLRGVHAKTSVIWNYKAPEGSGDTHYSIMRGTKANLIIRQGKEEKFQATLYIEPIQHNAAYKETLLNAMKKLAEKYNGIELSAVKNGWIVKIPDTLKEGHEAHFARVMENYLNYVKNNTMPAWEVPNMLAKYYTTTTALTLALKK
jgi:hypothetical protein